LPDSNLITVDTALTEKGEPVPSKLRPDGGPTEHDMLTGSDRFGRAFPIGLFPLGEDRTCHNWTSDSSNGYAMLGHHDRSSLGNTSWNSAHVSAGCDAEKLRVSGGAGRFYCFAAD
jgi:hypothetical protein